MTYSCILLSVVALVSAWLLDGTYPYEDIQQYIDKTVSTLGLIAVTLPFFGLSMDVFRDK